jgi:hypothetical protein
MYYTIYNSQSPLKWKTSYFYCTHAPHNANAIAIANAIANGLADLTSFRYMTHCRYITDLLKFCGIYNAYIAGMFY